MSFDNLGYEGNEKISKPIQSGKLFGTQQGQRILPHRLYHNIVGYEHTWALLIDFYFVPQQIVDDKIVAGIGSRDTETISPI